MSLPDEPDHEVGASTLEYAALVVFAIVLLGALVSLGLPGELTDGIEATICRIFKHSGCTDPTGQDAVKRNPDKPDKCLRSKSTTATDHNVKVVAYRRNNHSMTQVQRNSDGSISEVTGGNGVDIDGGYGTKIGKSTGVDATAGMNYMWNSKNTTQLDFTGNKSKELSPKEQRKEYHRLIAERKKAMKIEEYKRPWLREDHGYQQRIRQIPRDVAHELGVHQTTFTGNGIGFKAKADADLALLGLHLGGESSHITGTSTDDNGTDGPNDDTNSVTFSRKVEHKNSAGPTLHPFGKLTKSNKNPLDKIETNGKKEWKHGDATGYQIQSKNGKPTKLTITQQYFDSSGISGSGGGSGGGSGDNSEGKYGSSNSNSNTKIEKTTVELTEHPEVLKMFRNYLRTTRKTAKLEDSGPKKHPDGDKRDPKKSARSSAEDQAASATSLLSGYLNRAGQSSGVEYNRSSKTTGPEGSVSYFMEITAGKWTKTTGKWSVKVAHYYDRSQGKWVCWSECASH